jgi:hypothetical protein
MTVINTNYSSLEDAWGENFDEVKKPRKSKKNTAPLAPLSGGDPLCELYNKRYRKIKKPYGQKSSTPLDDEYLHRYNTYKSNDRRNYYGYQDDTYKKRMDPSRQSTDPLLIDPTDEDGVCIDVNAMPPLNSSKKSRGKKTHNKVRFIEPEDEDDVYLQNAVVSSRGDDGNGSGGIDGPQTNFKDAISNRKSTFNRIYSNVYDETDDEMDGDLDGALDDDLNGNIEEEGALVSSMVDTEEEESDCKLIMEELRKQTKKAICRPPLQYPETSTEHSRERHYLDFIIYILSGFILIFMMEQFIQIGIQMKMNY